MKALGNPCDNGTVLYNGYGGGYMNLAHRIKLNRLRAHTQLCKQHSWQLWVHVKLVKWDL